MERKVAMARQRRTGGNGTSHSLFTRAFVMLCAAMFLGYGNQWILAPVIPLYVDDKGGSAFLAGLALLAFAVPSFTVRPFVGQLADRRSAIGVLACGLILLSTGSALFLVPFLSMIFVGGIVRGLGWAGLNTGGYTTLAGIAPTERRGEAAGYYSSVTSGSAIIFPALGLWLITRPGGFEMVFLLSALLAITGLPFTLSLSRQGIERHTSKALGADEKAATLFDPGVLVSTGLNLCSTLSMPSVMAFLPLYARSLGIENIGLFYIVAGATNIIVRPLLGKWSDGMGRGPAIAMGLSAQLLGLALIMAASGLPLILLGGAFVALGAALIGSTTTALAMDLANPRFRGQAMATYSISYQIGAGVGSIIAGALADLVGLRGMYAGSIVITTTGIGLLAYAWKWLPRPAK
jgi:MFS family permease